MSNAEGEQGLRRYLSPFNVWALSFGCAVGWGAFIMPGTTFLPIAGPLGTALGILAGAAVMLTIGLNYHYMMNRCPDAGGTYAYVKHVFGYDHGFMSAWFIILVYMAIVWANITAFPLIFRNLLGNTFQVGLHYQVAGFDVYLGEALLSLSVMWAFGAACMRGGRLGARLQTVLAVVLLGGILVGLGAVVMARGDALPGFASPLTPVFAPGHAPLAAVLGIAVLSPWAFAGFESVSHGAEEFRFSPKKTFAILAAAVGTSAAAYIILSLLAVSVLPDSYKEWPDYLRNIGKMQGVSGVPTFYAVRVLLGDEGLWILGATLLAGVLTGLVGNAIAVSRLIYAMARDRLLPEWFSRLGPGQAPKNAILFVLLLSLPIPFLGRTAISWIVDVNTIGATIAYAYTSAVAFWTARKAGNSLVEATGAIGCLVSAVFFLYFMVPGFWSDGVMATESYLILVAWSILGFVFFRYVFQRDARRRFGKSTVVWMAMLFLIFFTSALWMRMATQSTSREVLVRLNDYYAEELQEHGVVMSETEREDARFYLRKQMDSVEASLAVHNMVQIALILMALFIMFNIYNLMMRRERLMEVQKAQAEESNRAKSTFFFNMSHDIRTPMNAIVGYVEMFKKLQGICEACEHRQKNCPNDIPPKQRDYLQKIDMSSNHLLSLINDILEMSRIESGKTELEIAPADLVKILGEARDLFATQMEAKGIRYTVDTRHVANRTVLCDAKRLDRVVLNLVSNAYKFTPEGGEVRVTLRQTGVDGDAGHYELRVKDTGIGMSKEFAAKVFDAYTRDRTVNNIQGTGLGMAITKSIVDLMGGSVEVVSEPGKGTEFIVRMGFPLAEELEESLPQDAAPAALDFSGTRILLVEDIEVNREIATMILGEFGFAIETAENGKIAVDMVAASRPGHYRLILMDVQMPVMNGYDAARAIRALPDPALSSIPIIAMTANAFAEDVQDAKDAGMDGHVAKPLDVPKMMETLARVLRERDPSNAR